MHLMQSEEAVLGAHNLNNSYDGQPLRFLMKKMLPGFVSMVSLFTEP